VSFLLDASVWIAFVNSEERFHAEATAVVESPRSLRALDLTLYEVTNVIGARMGKHRRAERLCNGIVTRCQRELVRVDAKSMDRVVDIAAEHGLTAYGAAYVAAARHHGWTLVSTEIQDLVSKGLAVAPDAAV
jgi:predicted nucleic acid-binding protein